VAEAGTYRIYEKTLAFLRTRALGAVLMPALVGAALAARRGEFLWVRFMLLLVGLAAAELINLFGSDYRVYRNPHRKGFLLPGNPVCPTGRLPASRIPVVLVPVASAALAVLVFFTLTVGFYLLLFLLAAGIVGALYVWSPFRWAFLGTAFIPPLISGGTYLALTGEASGLAFAAAVPITFISLAVILGYRVMYERRGAGRRRAWAAVLAAYSLAGINVVLYAATGVYPRSGWAAALPVALLLPWTAIVCAREKDNPIPATALGVLMHSATSVASAVVLLLA
jgi:hypothetical protein